MGIRQKKMVCVVSILVVGLFMVGCGGPVSTNKRDKKAETTTIDLETTIGSLVEVFSFDVIPVEGYGLVGGLNGTGSAECPPQIRAYLTQYLLKQLPEHKIDVKKFISSRDTAVVLVHGLMPTATSKNRYFDVRVVALPGTQTSSLKGGWLYGVDLKATGSFGITTKILANAKGPIFIDTTTTAHPNKKIGYILAGGTSFEEYKINMVLRRPDYRITSLIRDRLNGRFGNDTAKAVSPDQIELKVPAKYEEQKQRFISIVKAMYLVQMREVTQERIRKFIRKLATSEEKYTSEIALETIGNESLGKLAALLNSSNEQVRLRAARCMLNLGSDQGLDTLRQIAINKGSAYRIEALEAITAAASHNDAAAISRKLLRDDDLDIRLAAYENLRKLDDITITQELVGRNFYLEQIVQAKHKVIFVSRSGQSRIVLFGAPIYCRDNIFVQSANGNITINAPSGQKHVSIMRKHPKRANVIVQLKSSFDLGDIIRALCEEAVVEDDSQLQPGLGISYADMIGLLKQMCDKGAVRAEFRAGPLPKTGLIVKR